MGRSLNSYTVYLGGSHLGTRLGEVYLDNVKREEVAARLEPLLATYKLEGQPGEAFGDFCHRLGIAALHERFAASGPRG